MISKPSVVVVEDDADLRGIIADAFVTGGYNAVEIADGRTALKHLTSTSCDVMVIDIMIPGFNGIDLLTAVSNVNAVKIAISGSNNLRAEECYRGQADIFIRKPLKPDDILAFANRRLSKTQPHRLLVRDPLTARETEVLYLVAEGYSAEQIGVKLGISTNTVFKHRAAIKQKYGGISFIEICRRILEK